MIFNMRAKEVLGVIESDSSELRGSYESALKINKIGGVCVQGENPTPTNPQEIKKSVISEIRTHGKNFLQNTGTSIVSNGITFTVNEDGSVTANGTATAIANFTIYKSIPIVSGRYFNVIKLGGSYTGEMYHVAYDANWAGGKDGNLNTPSKMNDTINYSRFRLSIRSGAVCNNLTVGFMVSTVDFDSYEPYTESVITLSQPIELYGVGDVQDTIEGGKVKRKYGVEVFDGSNDEGWAFDSSINRIYNTILKNKTKRTISDEEYINMLSSALVVKSFNAIYRGTDGINVNASGTVSAKYSELTSLSEWKAHLQANPMTVVYELAEEVIEDLPLADQIALNSLQTFHGFTHVEFAGDVQPTLNSDYATNLVGAVALAVHAYNEIEKRFVTFNAEDGSANFSGNIVNNAYIVGNNLQANQMVFAQAVQASIQLISKGSITADTNIEAKGNIIAVNTIEAKGDLKGKDLYITNIGIGDGAPQPVEWVWDNVLARWVLCSIPLE